MQKLTAVKLSLNELKDVLRFRFPSIEDVGITSIIDGNKEEVAINVEQSGLDIIIEKEEIEDLLQEILSIQIDDVIIMPEDEEVIILAENINGIRLI